jgi:shikimate 5-dehydrogenase
MKLGLLDNNRGRSRTKNLHELLAELRGLNVTYQSMDIVDLTASLSFARELE